MKALTTPLLIVLGIVAPFTGLNWRSARGKLAAATQEIAARSNELTQATSKLAEQGAANETLRTQLKLHAGDLTGVSNQLQTFQARLKANEAKGRDTETRLAGRDQELSVARQDAAELRKSIAQFEARAKELAAEVTSVRAQLARETERSAALNASLNRAESEKSVLLQRFSDPSVLRARLTEVTAKPAGKSGKGYLELQPDGSIVLLQTANDERPPMKPADEDFRGGSRRLSAPPPSAQP